MKRKTKGIAFGGKSDGEQGNDLHKKKVRPVLSNWGSKKSTTKETDERSPVEHRPSYVALDYKSVRVSDVIVIDSKHRKMNEETASRIAESIRARGFLGSIVVRREKVVGDFGEREDARILLVAGRNRLRAAELLGLKEIPATFFKVDRRHARLVTIEENLFRKDLSALERAEHYAAWFRISAQLEDSGQHVRKPKAGRPEGGLSKLARELPISGKTVEARRKTMERSKAIAGISPKAKEAIKAAKLHNNQKALLEIAKEGAPYDQLKKVRELRTTRNTRRAAIKKRLTETVPVEKRGIYKDLLAAWDASPRFRKAWHRTPRELGERFINEVLRGSRGYSAEEAIDLVKDAFVGRKSILVQDLHRLGRRYGFNKRIIQNIARTFGYRKKRLSSNRFHPWSYMNTNKDWRNFPIISDDKFADVRPPEETQPKPIVADFNVDDDDEDLELPKRAPDPDFSDLD